MGRQNFNRRYTQGSRELSLLASDGGKRDEVAL